MDIVAFGTPLGLAFASGWNASLPLLAFALSVRWLHLSTVSPQFAFITHPWFLAALVILTILDFVAEKIPFVEQAWNASQGLIRPLAGALVALAAGNQALSTLKSAMLVAHPAGRETLVALSVLPALGVGPLVLLVIGAMFAALSHRTKSVVRIVFMLTAGFLTPVLSLVEDGVVVVIALLSLFAPTLMFFLLILLVALSTRQLLRLKNL